MQGNFKDEEYVLSTSPKKVSKLRHILAIIERYNRPFPKKTPSLEFLLLDSYDCWISPLIAELALWSLCEKYDSINEGLFSFWFDEEGFQFF